MEQTTAPLVSKSNLRDSSADAPLRFHGLMWFMSLICPLLGRFGRRFSEARVDASG